MYFPCDKFIRILKKCSVRSIRLAISVILVSCSKRDNSCRRQNRPIHWLAKQIVTVGQWKLYFHYKHTLPHCHWWHLLFFSSNSRKKKWLREAGKLLSVWMKAVSRRKRLTVSVFSFKYFYNCNLQSSLSYRFGSRLGHSHPPAKHEGPRLCIYLCRYMWTLAHMLQLGVVYYGASKFMYV